MDYLPQLAQVRRQRLARLMQDGVAVIFSSPTTNHPADQYRYNPNLYYLAGITEKDCALVFVAKHGRLIEEIVYCRLRDAVYERWHGPLLGPLRARRQLGIGESRAWQSQQQIIQEHTNARTRLFVEFNPAGMSLPTTTGHTNSNYRCSSMHNLQSLCSQLRAIKDAHELECIQASAALTCTAFSNLLNMMPQARSETQLAATLGHTYATCGGEHAFLPIVASGANACIAHYQQNNARLRRGRLLLVDTGSTLHRYAADMSRTIPINGKFTPAQKDLYNIVLAAQRQALTKIKPGGSLGDAQKLARKELARGLIYLGICRGKPNLVAQSAVLNKYFFHSIGHMIGLEVHDPATPLSYGHQLKKNMVLTVEPGLYLDNDPAVPKAIRNCGIRIEDTVAVTDRGHDIYTNIAPKTVRAFTRGYEMMTASIAILGAGPIGSATAILVAKLMPNTKITVFDAGRPSFGNRTFFIANGVWETWQDLGIWQHFANHAHPIVGVKANFANTFGGLRLAGDDCHAELIGYSFAEHTFIARLRDMLRELPAIHIHEPAQVTYASPDGQVSWEHNGSQHSQTFDLVAICGLPYSLLASFGFCYNIKNYRLAALVTTLHNAHHSHWAYERIMPQGAATLLPFRDGWGFILLRNIQEATALAALNDTDYLATLQKNRWLDLSVKQLAVVSRGMFKPVMRHARNPGIGRLALLGASACAVHPVGAQELNLGLRDALALANFIQQADEVRASDCGYAFAQLRVADRQNIVQLTDSLAWLLDWQAPWKLPLAGLAATAAGLCPPLRNYLLGQVLYPKGH